jgi:hypothetical protein
LEARADFCKGPRRGTRLIRQHIEVTYNFFRSVAFGIVAAIILNLGPSIYDCQIVRTCVADGDKMTIRQVTRVLIVLVSAGYATSASAQHCHREGTDAVCDDGRRGVWSSEAIIWPDGTRSLVSPHPSVVIGNKSSVTIGPGVFVGQGKGMVPLDDPNRTRCVTLDGVPYCN